MEQQEYTELVATTNCKISDRNNVYWSLMHKNAQCLFKFNPAVRPADVKGNICMHKARMLLD